MFKYYFSLIAVLVASTSDAGMFKSVEEAEQRYGVIRQGKWPDQKKWMVHLYLPEGYDHLIYGPTGEPVESLFINRDIKQSLLKVLEELTDKGLNTELRTYWGCFNIRNVINRNRLSAHSYGLACDFNVGQYPIGSNSRFNQSVIDIFIKHGFSYGGDWLGRPDPHHFSYSWE